MLCFVTAPYLGCTTNQRSIPFGYLLQLLVQEHQDHLLFFLESLQLLPGMLKYQETVDQESITEEIYGV
jgi:hypothetical protein